MVEVGLFERDLQSTEVLLIIIKIDFKQKQNDNNPESNFFIY